MCDAQQKNNAVANVSAKSNQALIKMYLWSGTT